jgi:hypothetical protein
MNEEERVEIEKIEDNTRIEEDKYKDMVHRERKYKGI